MICHFTVEDPRRELIIAKLRMAQVLEIEDEFVVRKLGGLGVLI